jgi:hypothetical protein
VDRGVPLTIAVTIVFALLMASTLPWRRSTLRRIDKGQLADLPGVRTIDDEGLMKTLTELRRCNLIDGEFIVERRGYLPEAAYDLRLTTKGRAELRRSMLPGWSKAVVSTVSGIVSGVISGLIVERVKR